MNSAGDTHNTMHPKHPQKIEKNNKKTEHPKKEKQNCTNAYLRVPPKKPDSWTSPPTLIVLSFPSTLFSFLSKILPTPLVPLSSIQKESPSQPPPWQGGGVLGIRPMHVAHLETIEVVSHSKTCCHQSAPKIIKKKLDQKNEGLQSAHIVLWWNSKSKYTMLSIKLIVGWFSSLVILEF